MWKTWLQLLWWDRRLAGSQEWCLIILYTSSDISILSTGPREGDHIICSEVSKRIWSYFFVFVCTGLNLLHGAKFQRFSSDKRVFQNSKFQIWEFHTRWPKLGTYSDWGLSSVLVINKHLSHHEEKFLKGSVGHQIKVWFWNKFQMTDLLLIQLATHGYMLTKNIKYQLYVLIDFIY